jgi:hypothetical protein
MKDVYPALSINAGVTGTWWANESSGISTGFHLVTKGAGIQTKDRDGLVIKQHSYEMVYGEVPVAAHVNFDNRKFTTYFYTGPSFNFRLFSNHRTSDKRSEYLTYEAADDKSDFKKADISALYGFGIKSPQKNKSIFFADLRLNIGVTPMGEINENKVYNHYYNIAAGYIF